MGTDTTGVVSPEALDELVAVLKRRGFRVVGPQVHAGAILYDEIESAGELPVGWTDVQEPGSYRLQRRDDDARFGYAVGPQSWKQFLDAKIVAPTSQNQPSIEDDLRGVVERSLDLPDDELQIRCEHTIRNHDPCISCSTHFLKLDVERL